jgi:hypothetical protein
MNHIFLIKSPLQLLNAIEAKHHYGLNDSECYLVIMGDRKSHSQLMGLVAIAKEWKSVVILNGVSLFAKEPWSTNHSPNRIGFRKSILNNSAFTIARINRLASHMTDVGYLFMGDYNNKFMRHFLNVTRHKETVLLDDGTATLDVARSRDTGESQRAPNSLYKRMKLGAKRIFQGLNDKRPDKVEFFTAYNVEVNAPDILERNQFTYLRNNAGALRVTNDVYFLGSPLSEVGLMVEKDYIDQLKMVRNKFYGREFIYVTHRREDSRKLDFIKANTDIKICSFEYPVEYQFAMIGPRPDTVVSFITSALDTLHVIFGSTITIISYKLIKGSYGDVERIEAVYNHYLTHASDCFQIRQLDSND